MGSLLSDWKHKTQRRWMTARDVEDIQFLAQFDWKGPTTSTLLSLEDDRSISGWMLEKRNHLVGYIIYQRLVGEIKILHFVIDGKRRLEGIGTDAMSLLKTICIGGKLSMTLDEYNVPGQLFLRSCGFACNHWHRVGNGSDQLNFSWNSNR